jgi:hypothetical protein
MTHYIIQSARTRSLNWVSGWKWRGIRRMGWDDRLATNRNIFLASSSINYPLIASEKNRTIPPPFYLLVVHFTTTPINNSFSDLFYCPTNTWVSCFVHCSLILIVSSSTSAWLHCYSRSHTVSARVTCASHSEAYYPALVLELLPHFLDTPHSHTHNPAWL